MKQVYNPLKMYLNRGEKALTIKDLYFLLDMMVSKSTLYAISSGLQPTIQKSTAEKINRGLGLPLGSFERQYAEYQRQLCEKAKEDSARLRR